jgi:NAD(P)-dependent dehydrogenase (short-subunit alcohol dehydrogenase family)
VVFPDRPRALITGAGSGLGRALAVRLADREGRVLVTDVRMDPAEETARVVRTRGGEAIVQGLDVTDPEQWAAARATIEAAWGGLDILVNNAGVAVAGRTGEIPIEDWRWLLDINLWGVIYGCHTFVPMLRAQRSGFILNVASSAGLLSAPELGPYNVAKAGVISLSETLYGELKEDDIHTTALCPTFFRSELFDRTRTTNADLRRITEKLIGQAGWTAEQIADVALRGLESGELYVIPQLDGQIMWRVKRTLGPGALQRMLRWVRNSKSVADGAMPWRRRGE